jgi:PAS domain S-box-containing protein
MEKRKGKAERKYEADFYKIMADNFGDEIFVTDGQGNTTFVNPAAVEVIGKPVYEIIGRNVKDLVEEGFFEPSVTEEVLRQQKTVSIIQKVRDGKAVLATGVPIFGESRDEITMVISTTKDVDALNQLLGTVESQEEELTNLRDSVFSEEGFISADDTMKEVKNTLVKIADLDMAILVEGETGVGKEVAVRTIHRFGMAKKGPLFKINCGTIPENLIESELFGYEAGAFTGAERTGKKGKVEMADGGTLFLDEVGELPLSLQVKLLDFLQEGTFTRVGGTTPIKINARVIAATNRDLRRMCEEGTFRKDLYYRLSVIPVRIPPLRERPADIDALIRYFISKFNSKYRNHKTASADFYEAARSYEWPGNVRELEHTLERIYVMTESNLVTMEDFEKAIRQEDPDSHRGQSIICMDIMPLKEAKWQVEKQLVRQAYRREGSTYKAAELLKVDQSTVVKLLKKHQGK